MYTFFFLKREEKYAIESERERVKISASTGIVS